MTPIRTRSVRAEPSRDSSGFYFAGGTLDPDRPSYVRRPADTELLERLRAGDYCYVLSTRQMGKSSLMARTAQELRRLGTRTAVVDLTQIGRASAEQLYFGTLNRIRQELGLDLNLTQFWKEREALPFPQRMTEFFEQVVLPGISDPLVIFLDEIDVTLKLQGNDSDSLFAVIRAFRNARATNGEMARLTWVLLGVTSPPDLIRDKTGTPYNIGTSIAVDDFSLEEAQKLAQGLVGSPAERRSTLEAIWELTRGHPYLTQKLCQLSAAEGRVIEPAEVESIASRYFLAAGAKNKDDNLRLVQDRVLDGNDETRVAVLRAYGSIRRRPTQDEPLSPIMWQLKLAGLVKRDDEGFLRVRNRVYRDAFDERWIRRSMPRAVVRSLMSLVAGVSLLVVVAVSIGAWLVFVRPKTQRAENLMGFLQTDATTKQDIEQVFEYLSGSVEDPVLGARISGYSAEAREYRGAALKRIALSRRSDRDQLALVRLSARSYDEALLWAKCHDENLPAKLEHAEVKGIEKIEREKEFQWLERTFRGHSDRISDLAFSENADRLVSASWDKTLRIWGVGSDGSNKTPPVASFEFAVDAVKFGSMAEPVKGQRRSIVTAVVGGQVAVVDGTAGNIVDLLRVGPGPSVAQASPDGTELAVGGELSTPDRHRQIAILDLVAPKNPVLFEAGHGVFVSSLRYSADGRSLLSIGHSDPRRTPAQLRESVTLWSAKPLKKRMEWVAPGAHIGAVDSAARRVAAAGDDGIVRVWDSSNPEASPLLLNASPSSSPGPVVAVAFCALDAAFLMSAHLGNEGARSQSTLFLWALAGSPRVLASMTMPDADIEAADLSADCRLIAAAWALKQPSGQPLMDRTIRIWALDRVGSAWPGSAARLGPARANDSCVDWKRRLGLDIVVTDKEDRIVPLGGS